MAPEVPKALKDPVEWMMIHGTWSLAIACFSPVLFNEPTMTVQAKVVLVLVGFKNKVGKKKR